MKISVLKKWLLITAAFFLLIGCGGGGESAIDSKDKKTYPPATISGVTEPDFLIKNADVTISDIEKRVVVTTKTDESGKYEIEIGEFLKPLVITLTCNEDSVILQEGNEEICDKNTVLKSVVPTVYPDQNIRANITLLSDLTYYIARELGGITKENIEDAKAIISQTFGGIDPVQSDPSKGKYYSVLRSLHQSNFDKTDTKQSFIKALSDGKIDPNDPDEKEILDVISKKLKSNYQTNILTDAVDKRIIYILPPVSPTDEEGDPDIKAAKDMLEEIRGEVLSIKNYKNPSNPSFYDKELENFRKVTNDYAMPNSFYAAGFFLKMTDLIKQSEEEGKDELTSSFEREDGSESFELLVRRESEEPKNYESFDYMILGNDQNYSGTFTYIPEDENDPGFKNAKTYKFSGTLPLADKSDIKEGIKDEEIFKGKASRFNKDDNSYYLVMSATIKTQNEDMTESVYNIKDSKFLIHTKESVNDSVVDMESADAEFIVVDISIKDYSLKGMFRFSDFKQNSTFTKNGGRLPTVVSFSGSTDTAETNSSFKGDIQIKSKNFENVDFSTDERDLYEIRLSGELQIPNRDKILVTVYSDQLQRYKFYNEVSYTHGTKTTFAAGDIIKDKESESYKWDITIRNQQNIAMHAIGDESGEFSGDVKKENSVIGTLEKLNDIPIVRFNDGTFESIP